MSPEIAVLARHRLERAREAFREGDALLETASFRGAVSRFYYAALHAGRALLATRGVDSSRHSGVIRLFHEHFVKSGLVQPDIARAFQRSFEKRLNTDYADFSDVTAEEITRVRAEVLRFIDTCGELLERLLRERRANSTADT